eukprot:5824118-Pyramimonas_sp.AAC.2
MRTVRADQQRPRGPVFGLRGPPRPQQLYQGRDARPGLDLMLPRTPYIHRAPSRARAVHRSARLAPRWR